MALGALLAWAALCGCERATGAYCEERLPPGQVTVETLPVRYTTEQIYPTTELDRRESHHGFGTTLGLTTGRALSKIEIALSALHVPGGVCVRPRVHVTLSYAPVTVDLARELRPGSCHYTEVLGHEMRHVRAYASYLAVAKRSLESSLASELPRERIYRFGSMEEANRFFEDLQDQTLSPLSQQALDGVRERQRAIDTPEEYQRLGRVCGPWVR